MRRAAARLQRLPHLLSHSCSAWNSARTPALAQPPWAGSGGGYRRFRDEESRWLSPGQRAAIAASLALGGVVYVTHLEAVPLTGRTHLVLLSPEAEASLGKQAYTQLMAQHAGAVLPATSPQAARVRRVGARVVAAVQDDPRLARLAWLRDCNWSFTVVRSGVVNACVLPGGFVVVFTGVLDLFPGDDELAVVLAHEAGSGDACTSAAVPAEALLQVGHTVARHPAERATSGMLASLLKLLLALATGEAGLTGALVELGLFLPHSRRAELEADAIGLELAARACYDTAAAPRVFRALGAAAQGRAPPAWLSTHPANAERVRAVTAAAPAAQQAAEAAGCADRRAAWRLGSRFG